MILMSVLKKRIVVLRTVTTLLVVTLAPAMLVTVSMSMAMIVMILMSVQKDLMSVSRYVTIPLVPMCVTAVLDMPSIVTEEHAEILMNVHLKLIAVIRTATITLVHTHAAVMQVGVLTLMASAAMILMSVCLGPLVTPHATRCVLILRALTTVPASLDGDSLLIESLVKISTNVLTLN